MQRTEIEELGEFGLIGHLTKDIVHRQPSTLLGVGDDGAVIDPAGKRVVVSTDLLCEGVHFDLSYVPLKHLGYKAIAVNISDICAMNALPTQVTVSIAVSKSVFCGGTRGVVPRNLQSVRGVSSGFGRWRHLFIAFRFDDQCDGDGYGGCGPSGNTFWR